VRFGGIATLLVSLIGEIERDCLCRSTHDFPLWSISPSRHVVPLDWQYFNIFTVVAVSQHLEKGWGLAGEGVVSGGGESGQRHRPQVTVTHALANGALLYPSLTSGYI